MDFLDPKKWRRYEIQLIAGYILLAIAILIATLVLLYAAYGFGVSKGKVIQKAVVYVSSHPAGAQIYLDNSSLGTATNARLSIISGNHLLKISRTGYVDWQRSINVVGGSVEHFDYPFLVPSKLVTTDIKSYDTAPGLVTESLDHRWLLVQHGTTTTFDEYDLQNPKLSPVTLTLPDGVATDGTAQTWQAVEWAGDNIHVLLQHTYSGKTEFILLNRSDATQSLNLDTTLKATPTSMTLRDSKFDQYYLYDSTTQALDTASLGSPTPVTLLQHVLNFTSYGSDNVLYAASTDSKDADDAVEVDLYQSGQTYRLRKMPAGTTYPMDLSRFNGSWYAAFGASSENRIYVYKNPVTQLNSTLGTLVPVYELNVTAPNYVAFSANSQYVTAENGSSFAVFDAWYDEGYTYNAGTPLDKPQPHAAWMDGNRLMYVSDGKLVIFDYDHTNVHTLEAADSAYVPIFDPSYKFVDVIGPPNTVNQLPLTSTALLTPADQ